MRLQLVPILFLIALEPLTNRAGQQSARSALCSGANGRVSVVLLQQDGKILLGGSFTNVGGQPRAGIGRLNPDGSVDTTFNPSANSSVDTTFNPGTNNTVAAMALQADGKILVGGDFDQLDGQPRAHIGRLNADGSLDGSFSPGATPLMEDPRFPALQVVTSIAVQTDGRILVGGRFHTLAGQPRPRIGRLNGDGSLDTSFNAGAEDSPTSTVAAIVLQSDGKIVVDGQLTRLGGQSRINLSRLNPDGSLDTSFNPGFSGPGVPGGDLRALAIQMDGKILIGGGFGFQSALFISRLNADGSVDDAFNSDANKARGIVDAIALQADGKILVAEDSYPDMFFESIPIKLARLNPDGTPDSVFNAVLTYQNNFLPGVSSLAVQPNGEIIVGGNFDTINGDSHNAIGRLLTDGRINPTDCPDTGFNAAPVDEAFSIAVQPDGKTLVGAPFRPDRALLGISGGPPGRLNADGSLDVGFNPGALGIVDAMAVQPDGKILVGGFFSWLDGQSRIIIGRLNPDGTLDASFNANGTFPPNPSGQLMIDERPRLNANAAFLNRPAQNVMLAMHKGSHIDANAGFPDRPGLDRAIMRDVHLISYQHGPPSPFVSVNALALQPDGKILVGGEFRAFGPRGENIARLNGDGSVDAAFSSQANKGVLAMALQPDGKVLVGGAFNLLNGERREQLGRLNPDGSLDPTFVAKVSAGVPASVLAIALQADGKILVGGFSQPMGQPQSVLIQRINTDGSLDTSFNLSAGSGSGAISTMAVQADGKILVAGRFSAVGGQPRANIARLNADGTLDNFNPGAEGDADIPNNHAVVNAVVLQANGQILVAGLFDTFGGQPRRFFGRLANPTPAVQSLAVNPTGTEVIWSRSGACPEVTRVTFEFSRDGATYRALGRGKRISTGWKRSSLKLPIHQRFFIRAGGYYGGSIVESVAELNPNS